MGLTGLPADHLTVDERFWVQIAQVGDCWEWTGYKERGGYGQFYPAKRIAFMAHRFAYEVLVGPIPAGLHLDHLCRNRACVNAYEHLDPVPTAVNTARGERAQRTECLYGHAYDEANTQWSREGHRRCRECRRLSYQRRQITSPHLQPLAA